MADSTGGSGSGSDAFPGAQGYRILRFWNNDAIENIDGVLETIRAQLLAQRLAPSPNLSRKRRGLEGPTGSTVQQWMAAVGAKGPPRMRERVEREDAGSDLPDPTTAFPFCPRALHRALLSRPLQPSSTRSRPCRESARAFEYFIDTVYEAGIALTGTEVKSLRFGEGSIAEAYAEVKDEQVCWSMPTSPNSATATANHEPKRPRKLLLHEREINKLHGAVAREGMTLIPLSVYFNGKGARRSSWRSRRARRRMTSARPSRIGMEARARPPPSRPGLR